MATNRPDIDLVEQEPLTPANWRQRFDDFVEYRRGEQVDLRLYFNLRQFIQDQVDNTQLERVEAAGPELR